VDTSKGLKPPWDHGSHGIPHGQDWGHER